MTNSFSRLYVLIDHGNVAAEPRDIVHAVVTGLQPLGATVEATLRIYGGWYEGYTTTALRYEAAGVYQDTCPIVLQIAQTLVRISLEFADDLWAARTSRVHIPITHTVGLRRTAGELVVRQGAPMCQNNPCGLMGVKRWVRKKAACHERSCPHDFAEMFQRREQKQVDVHMGADLVAMASSADPTNAIAVVTDDLDILPALLQAAMSSGGRISHVRSRTRRAMYCDPLLAQLGVSITAV